MEEFVKKLEKRSERFLLNAERVYEVTLEFVREREETFKNAWKILKKII